MSRKRDWLAEVGAMPAIVPLVELRAQGMKPKQIAKLLDMSERTIRRFVAAGTFPEAHKRREAGRAPLARLLPTSSSVGKRESGLASRFGAKSRNRATPGRSEVCIGTWKHSSKRK